MKPDEFTDLLELAVSRKGAASKRVAEPSAVFRERDAGGRFDCARVYGFAQFFRPSGALLKRIHMETPNVKSALKMRPNLDAENIRPIISRQC